MDYSVFLDVLQSYYLIIGLFFIIAIIYASAGFGGGSSYLAVLSLTSLSFLQYRAIALLCNIVVVSGGTYLFVKNGYFNWKRVLPIVITSVPLAFIGGLISVEQSMFFIVLGFVLIFASIMMWLAKGMKGKSNEIVKPSVVRESSLGAIIGFVSGVVGIGGGVFLAPTLHLTNWGTSKRIAATSSFFILINSISGLIGQYVAVSGIEGFSFNFPLMIILAITVFIGGQIGSRVSVRKLSPTNIKRITAILIFIVGLRLLFKYLLV